MRLNTILLQPQIKCSIWTQMHCSCFKRSPNIGVWQYLKSKQVKADITGCVWTASPAWVWWCSRPRRPGSSAGWSCQRCPAPGARSGPPAQWFPSVFQWQRVSPAWGREGGGVTDERSHHRVPGTLTAPFYSLHSLPQDVTSLLQWFFCGFCFLFFFFIRVTTFSKTWSLMTVNHLKAFFCSHHRRHRVDGADFMSPEVKVTYLLSFSHGDGVSCRLVQGP